MLKILKLVTGEELVGDVSDSNGVVKIKQPCSLHLMPGNTEQSKPMLILMPYAMYVEGHSITVDPSIIVWSGEPVKDLYNQYNSIYGTGIQLAHGI